MGQRLGNLLSLHLMVEDMTQVKHESDLFGPNPPYMGFEKRSKLNNFLADNSGKRAVVMLDEIEKASPEVLDSLLIVLDEGMNAAGLAQVVNSANNLQADTRIGVQEALWIAER